MSNKKIKALALFSGGLDSILAVKVLEAQGVEVEALCFVSNFFTAKEAVRSARENNIKLRLEDISPELLALVKNPPSGHGKNMNPCLDCHALMAKRAGEIASREGFALIISGEVLGQRPFSQKKEALRRVMKIAGVEILRPLSAKLLEPTQAETDGLVDRERLLALSGRGRGGQKEWAEKLGLKYYPSPAGGCLLTDKTYSQKLAEMLANWPEADTDKITWLKRGRVFWLTQVSDGQERKVLVVLGHDEKENAVLNNSIQKGDLLIRLATIPGPYALVKSADGQGLEVGQAEMSLIIPTDYAPEEKALTTEKLIEEIAKLVAFYSRKNKGEELEFAILKS